MQKLYFTPNELAIRWDLSCDDVCMLGAEGLIQFGIYVDTPIMLELGSYEPPNYAFQKKDEGIFSPGFFPITKRAVLHIMSHRSIDMETMTNIFPNTECGLVIRVASWMSFGEGDHKGVPLLVTAEEVERYETNRGFVPAGFPTDAGKKTGKQKEGALLQATAVADVLARCETRAAETGEAFDRQEMPGQKKHFLELMRRLEPGFRNMTSIHSLDRYLKGQCKWSIRARSNPDATPLYQKLFPEAWGTPGAVSENRKKA